jgi:hypothetical protein
MESALKGQGFSRKDIGDNTSKRTGDWFRVLLAASLGFPNLETFNAWAFAQSQDAHRTSVRDFVTCYLATSYGGASVGLATAPVVLTGSGFNDYYLDVLGAGKFISRLQVTATYSLLDVTDDVVVVQVFGLEPNGDFITLYVPPGKTCDIPLTPEVLRSVGVAEGAVATASLRIRITAPSATASNPVHLMFNGKAGPVPEAVADIRIERAMNALGGADGQADSDERAGRGLGAGASRLGRVFADITAPGATALLSKLGVSKGAERGGSDGRGRGRPPMGGR